jgi:hypothetical protein
MPSPCDTLRPLGRLPGPEEEWRDLSERDETIEKLRGDLFAATANRGLVYTAILREMRKELGEEKASQIFKRAIFDHGAKMAGFRNGCLPSSRMAVRCRSPR